MLCFVKTNQDAGVIGKSEARADDEAIVGQDRDDEDTEINIWARLQNYHFISVLTSEIIHDNRCNNFH